MKRVDVPATSEANVAALREMLEVVEALRAPGGCPWDREQTHETLRPYLLEETYEALEAIEGGSPDDLREELGDVLLQVFMHHAIAAEAGAFTIADVASHAAEKMIHRHPHVFGEVEVDGADQVVANWEGLKGREARKRGRVSALEGAPQSLPALAWALSLQKRAARVGFDLPPDGNPAAQVAGLMERLSVETDVPRAEAALGELLLAVVEIARRRKLNPEDALRRSARGFKQHFERMEAAAVDAGQDIRNLDSAALAGLWASTSE